MLVFHRLKKVDDKLVVKCLQRTFKTLPPRDTGQIIRDVTCKLFSAKFENKQQNKVLLLPHQRSKEKLLTALKSQPFKITPGETMPKLSA